MEGKKEVELGLEKIVHKIKCSSITTEESFATYIVQVLDFRYNFVANCESMYNLPESLKRIKPFVFNGKLQEGHIAKYMSHLLVKRVGLTDELEKINAIYTSIFDGNSGRNVRNVRCTRQSKDKHFILLKKGSSQQKMDKLDIQLKVSYYF